MLIAAIAAYVLAQIGIGWWASRRTSNTTDYYVAGRSFGVLAVSLSLFATWFGAETVMGSSAAVAEGGLSEARAEPFGYFLCLLLMGLFVAGKLRAGGHLTLADFFRKRFGPQSETWCVIANVPASIVWAAAQLTALAVIVAALTDLPVQVTLGISAGAVILYTALGGLRGDVITDMVQGVILLGGLALVLVFLLMRPGGLDAISAIRPEQLSLIGEGESWLARIDAWSIPILGSLVTSEAVARFLGSRDAAVARRASFVAAGLYLVAGAAPLLIGLMGPHLGLPLGAGDQFLPELAKTVLPSAVLVVFVGALLSAILSTVDSNILSVSALLTHNVIERVRPSESDASRLSIARVVTVLTGLAAWAIAAAGESIYDLVEWTSAFGTSGVLVAFLFGAYAMFGGGRAAVAAIVAGFGCNFFAVILPSLTGGEEMEGAFLLSLLASLAAYVIVAGVERVRQPSAALP
jgi:Na+/proline symporter